MRDVQISANVHSIRIHTAKASDGWTGVGVRFVVEIETKQDARAFTAAAAGNNLQATDLPLELGTLCARLFNELSQERVLLAREFSAVR